MDFHFQPSVELLPNAKAAAVFVPDSGTVFREDTKLDSRVLNGGQRFIPWGVDNAMPYNIISKIEDDETLATCMQFNAEVCYGAGLQYNTEKCTAQVQSDIEDFLLQNDLASYFLGVSQDFKYFAFAVSVLIFNKDASKIVRIVRKEACNCRFAPADKRGNIPWVLFADLVKPLQAVELQLLTSKPLPYKQLIALVDYIRQHPDTFPEWQTSPTAELFKPHAFENKKESGGYWF